MKQNDFTDRAKKMIADSFEVEEGWRDGQENEAASGTGFVHVPARGSLEIYVLSEEAMSYKGHYTDGRMRPCLRNGCIACSRSIGIQRRWVFSVYDIGRRVSGLLDLGDAPAGLIRDFSNQYGGLRGLRLRLGKAGGTLRGRIEVELGGLSRVPNSELPDSVNVADCLRKMWSDQSSKDILGHS